MPETGRSQFTVVAGPEFTLAANALRVVDSAMPARLRSKLRDAMRPIIADVRLAATALPARGARHTGLRGRVAKGVGIRMSVGERPSLRVTTSMDNPQEMMLPRGLDSGDSGWRHPVFGQQDVWVHQRGGSWFRETIGDDQDIIERHLTEVLEWARDTVADSGRA